MNGETNITVAREAKARQLRSSTIRPCVACVPDMTP